MTAPEMVKLRMKIGAHEFDAEGPHDLVLPQREIWKQLAGLPGDNKAASAADTSLVALFAVDQAQQSISLRVALTGQRRNADAALLLLYGYRSCLTGDTGEISARHLKADLAASGHPSKRLDRVPPPTKWAPLSSVRVRSIRALEPLTVAMALDR
ncbi:MAG: hypothetical protein HY270_05975 [Deltaproteobacteria bacterium]|nr:hypothetical protein [Deltaproteobacteria bacterium]